MLSNSRTNRKVKKESFMQGVLALMVSQVLIKFLGFAYKWYLTNKDGFGDEGNAIYSAGFQIYALLLSISSIGVPNAVSKLVAERLSLGDTKGAHRIFKIAFATFGVIGLVGTLLLLCGAGTFANTMGIPEAEMTLVALSPSIFFVSIMSVIRGFFNGRSKIKVTANSQTLEQVFKTVLTIIVVEIVAVLSGTNTTLMAAGANLATTLATVASFLYLFTYYKIHKKDKYEIEDIAKNANIKLRISGRSFPTRSSRWNRRKRLSNSKSCCKCRMPLMAQHRAIRYRGCPPKASVWIPNACGKSNPIFSTSTAKM